MAPAGWAWRSGIFQIWQIFAVRINFLQVPCYYTILKFCFWQPFRDPWDVESFLTQNFWFLAHSSSPNSDNACHLPTVCCLCVKIGWEIFLGYLSLPVLLVWPSLPWLWGYQWKLGLLTMVNFLQGELTLHSLVQACRGWIWHGGWPEKYFGDWCPPECSSQGLARGNPGFLNTTG